MNKAIIGMSGGVDSSVAVFLMKERGFEVSGVTFRLFESSPKENEDDAKKVADRLSIPHFVKDYTADFRSCVIDKFVSDYENELTPNPCVECNRHIKFKKLFSLAQELGFSHIVTGHYACIEEKNGRFLLKKAVDKSKDQTYFLFSLTQEMLSKTVFPLGEMTKSQIREIAEREGFVNAKRRDSQDICFVPDKDYVSVIESYSQKKYPEGDFVDLAGKVLGRHRGVIRYTIGQRKGLGLALPAPMYVVEKRISDNKVVLGFDEDLRQSTLVADDLNWIMFDTPPQSFRAKVKVRYSQSEHDGTVTPIEGGRVKVEFDTPVRAITKGQAVVFYDGDYVIGGGTII